MSQIDHDTVTGWGWLIVGAIMALGLAFGALLSTGGPCS